MIGSDGGLASVRHQPIIQSKDDLGQCHVIMSPGFNKHSLSAQYIYMVTLLYTIVIFTVQHRIPDNNAVGVLTKGKSPAHSSLHYLVIGSMSRIILG